LILSVHHDFSNRNEFQDLLRPAFQEDDWILIVVGGFLGAMAGVFQLVFMFGVS
jgi:hypothetical protein